MAITKAPDKTNKSNQEMQNLSFDIVYNILARGILGHDGVSMQRENSANVALKVTEVGDITYLGLAATGTAQGTAKWQCRKIDETSGVVITWADGNADFDNIATDLTALDYS